MTTETETTPASPSAPRLALKWSVIAIVVILATLLLAAGVAGSALWWALTRESGTAWVLARVPGLTVVSPRGALLGDFSAERMTIAIPPAPGAVVLGRVGWRGLHIARSPAAGVWASVHLAELRAERIDLQLAPSPPSNKPLAPPASLALPIELEIDAVRVGELHAAALGDQPVRDMHAHVHLGDDGGARHRLDQIGATLGKLQATGALQIATRGEMPLGVRVDVTQTADSATSSLPTIAASATLTGPLQRPLLHATADVTPPAPKSPQSLVADATLQPFAPWPLATLRASVQALDLSALVPAAPLTALTGEATVASTGIDQPAVVHLALANPEAGPWSDGRLPVRELTLDMSGKPNDPNTLSLQTLDIALGSAKQPGGRLQGSGRWTPSTWQLDATLTALQAAALDARAPAMRLSGPVVLKGSGFGGADADAATIALTADLLGTGFPSPAMPSDANRAELKLDLSLNPRRIEVRTLRAAVAGAHAVASGVAERDDADPNAPRWQVKARAALKDFDPRPWWPGTEGSAWRIGPHRLNAQVTVDLAAPARAESLEQTLAALRGQANADITDSVLAGVPITGQIALRAAAGGTATASLKLDAAGNAIVVDGTLATAISSGASSQVDRWTGTITAPALDRLAPLYRLLQPAGADARLAGSLDAHVQVKGRWPHLDTQGDLDANDLRAGAASVRSAQARWALGSTAEAKVDLQATIADAVLSRAPALAAKGSTRAAGNATGDPAIESIHLSVQGTGRDHRVDLQATAKALPPEWVSALQGPPGAASDPSAPERSSASIQAQGSLIDGGGWRGQIRQLALRSGAPSAPALLRASDLQLDARWSGGPPRLAVQPNRLELLGASLSWTQLSWQAAANEQPAQIEVDASLAPLRVAPLLAALQPDFGWGGDLLLTGHAKISSATAFSADVVLERKSGDLSVTDETQATLPLGLTDLRVALNADGGVWSFTQALAGKTIGVGAGAIVARTSPQASMPPSDAPVEGVLQVNVADLGSLGPWLAPGWRVGGVLEAKATIGGRFGAPEYTGSVTGTRLGVRNFLQGVNVTDGDMALSLRGSTAHIERFTAQAGEGTIRIEGGAELGAAPTAQLKVIASRFQVLGRVDRRIAASGQAELKLDANAIALAGRFEVDQGLIDFTQADAPRLSDDVEVVRGAERMLTAAQIEAAAAEAAAKASTPKRPVTLDLQIGLGQDLKLRGRGFATGLRGDLRLTAPGGHLAAVGTIRTEGGNYNAYGQKLTVDKGTITFTGAIDNPRLDIEATRPNIDVRAGVAISGYAQNPRIRLFSEPDLSEVDKLSWLVMGRASDGLGRTETALVQRAALALLSGEGESTTDKFTKAIGLDEISIGSGESGDVRSSVITLGKQISKRWYVGYEQGLNATGGSFQLIYRVAQRFTLRAQSGSDNSVDGIWTWRWK